MIETRASKSFALRRGDTPVAYASKDELRATRVSPLLWLNLTCLDAPLVAVSWQWLFARTFGIPSVPGGASALFLTAWLIYLTDRFGDGTSIQLSSPTSLRQRFALRHRVSWIMMMAVVAAADFVVIISMLPPRTLVVGGALGAFALFYLTLNRFVPSLWYRLPLKEISIGFLFAAGVITPLAHGLTSAVRPAWLLFAGLCSLNCISIAVWERDFDMAQRRVSIATAFPAVERCLLVAQLLLSVASGALAFTATTDRNVLVCVGASAALLATVHVCRAAVQADARTALADLVLLTPVFALLSQA
ncbi:MAG: hypothetical protein H0W04_02890 [Chthoniobacterales bacterium]|nr:hypothetical protein [Chthoniobacterales bacterium]